MGHLSERFDNGIQLRPITPTDIPQIWRLRTRGTISPLEYMWLLSRPGSVGAALECDGKMVGYAIAIIDGDEIYLTDAFACEGAGLAQVIAPILTLAKKAKWIVISEHCHASVAEFLQSEPSLSLDDPAVAPDLLN